MGTAPGSSPLGAGQAVDGEYHDEHRCGLDIAAKSCLKVFQEEPNRNRSDSAHVVFFYRKSRNMRLIKMISNNHEYFSSGVQIIIATLELSLD